MGRCRVVAPNVDRLSLSEGDFLDVLRELNAGQYVEMLRQQADRVPFAKVVAYLVGWSFVGLDGQPLPYDLDLPEPVRRATIGSLDKATLREITTAVGKHDDASEAAIDAKKKTPALSVASTAP